MSSQFEEKTIGKSFQNTILIGKYKSTNVVFDLSTLKSF